MHIRGCRRKLSTHKVKINLAFKRKLRHVCQCVKGVYVLIHGFVLCEQRVVSARTEAINSCWVTESVSYCSFPIHPQTRVFMTTHFQLLKYTRVIQKKIVPFWGQIPGWRKGTRIFRMSDKAHQVVHMTQSHLKKEKKKIPKAEYF